MRKTLKVLKCTQTESEHDIDQFPAIDPLIIAEYYDVTVSQHCRYCGKENYATVNFLIRFMLRENEYWEYYVIEKSCSIDHNDGCPVEKASGSKAQKAQISFDVIRKVFQKKRIVSYEITHIDDHKNTYSIVKTEPCLTCSGKIRSKLKLRMYDLKYCFMYRSYDDKLDDIHEKGCPDSNDINRFYASFNFSNELTLEFLASLFPEMTKKDSFMRIYNEEDLPVINEIVRMLAMEEWFIHLEQKEKIEEIRKIASETLSLHTSKSEVAELLKSVRKLS